MPFGIIQQSVFFFTYSVDFECWLSEVWTVPSGSFQHDLLFDVSG
ncbi:unnamed protein product [Arabidopsis lyrata]|nr:unnamed protein product [Arabidopsis lyrata]